MLLGCGSKKSDATDDKGSSAAPSSKTDPDPKAQPKIEPTVAEPVEPPSFAGDGVGPVKSSEDFKGRSVRLVKEITTAYELPDCDRMGGSLAGIAAFGKSQFKLAKEWADAHPDDKQAASDASSQQLHDAAAPLIEKCKDSKMFVESQAKVDAMMPW